MPYSDNPPPMVVGDYREGRRWRELNRAEGLDIRTCPDFKPGGILDYMNDHLRPTLEACRNRRREGDPNHNWCYRCVNGLIAVSWHREDYRGDDTLKERGIRL